MARRSSRPPPPSFALNRQQLYDLVWSHRDFAKRIGTTPTVVESACKLANVPSPVVRYWKQLNRGGPSQQPLPPRDVAAAPVVRLNGVLPPALKDKLAGEPGVVLDDEPIKLLAARFRERLGDVPIPRLRSRQHPAVEEYMKRHETNRWYVLDATSRENTRRLTIVNAIFSALSRVGAVCEITSRDAATVSVGIAGTVLPLHLDYSMTSRQLGLSVVVEERPKGVVLSWRDDDELSLEKKIVEVVVGLGVAAESVRRLLIIREAEKQAFYQEQLAVIAKMRADLIEEETRRREAENAKARTDALDVAIEGWERSAKIREYVAAVRERADLGHPQEAIDRWARWALSYADSIDPFRSGAAEASIAALDPDFSVRGKLPFG